MEEAHKRLLERITASKHFSRAPSLARILTYICSKTAEPDAAPLKEYEIAVNVLGRRDSFDPKLDPIVRVNVATIRERLNRYFSQEGEREALRLSIRKGRYKAHFLHAGLASGPEFREGERFPAFRKFWQPYLNPARDKIAVFSELLFYRNDDGSFLRNIYINDLNAPRQQLAEAFGGIGVDDFVPTYHFISAGEMHCMYELSKMFGRIGVDIVSRNMRFLAWTELGEADLILIGSSRTNHFLDSLQGENDFIITEREIVNRSPRPGERERYRGLRRSDGKLTKLTEFALVTRISTLSPGCSVTLICANHGRAIEGAGRYITNEDCLNQLFEKVGARNLTEPLPADFQLLLQVELIDFDEEVIQTDYRTHRFPESAD